MKTLPEIQTRVEQIFNELYQSLSVEAPDGHIAGDHTTVYMLVDQAQLSVQVAIEAIAKELMGCLPEYRMPRPGMEPIIPTSIKDRYLEHEDTGFNKALDEVRARLTAFIGHKEQ